MRDGAMTTTTTMEETATMMTILENTSAGIHATVRSRMSMDTTSNAASPTVATMSMDTKSNASRTNEEYDFAENGDSVDEQ